MRHIKIETKALPIVAEDEATWCTQPSHAYCVRGKPFPTAALAGWEKIER